MKKSISVFLAFLLLLFTLPYASAEEITDSFTPTKQAHLKYAIKLGNGYRNAPTPPITHDGYLITVSAGKLYKYNADDGRLVSSTTVSGRNFYTVVSPLVHDGHIYVQSDDGKVQAFSFDTLESKWIYTDPLGGQALCPLIADGENIYTGFWNGETEDASYVCLSTKDDDPGTTDENKKAQWRYISAGGFYCVSAAINENCLILGKDNGNEDSISSGEIVSLSKEDGKVLSSLLISGDIRSSIAYSMEADAYYTVSKAGYIYKFFCDEKTGSLHSLQSFRINGELTASPVCYKTRLYIFGSENGTGKFMVFDNKTLEPIYTDTMKGYPQAAPLLSTAYEKDYGYVYIYATYNSPPGGITVFEDKENQVSPKKTELFMPDSSHSQYCISPVTADNNGVLYYKNDSGYIFAVEESYEKSPLYKSIAKVFSQIIAFLNKLIQLIQTEG